MIIDIHCHVLPGIDDGPKNWEQSIALCRALCEERVDVVIATPHLIDGVWENTLPVVAPLVDELRKRLSAEGISLEVRTGAEVDISSRFVATESDDLPLLGGQGAALLEMPVAVVPPAMPETIFALRSRSILPVLAHPERNEVLQSNRSLAGEWVEAGAALQLDGDSLIGVWGPHTKRCAERLLVDGLFHAMASDAHSCDKRPPRVQDALECARKLIGGGADKLVGEGPAAILSGVCPPTPMYEPGKRGRRTTRGSGWKRFLRRS